MPVAGRVHYLEERPSPDVRSRGALVFLHAFPLNAQMWDAQLAACAERGWHAIAPHMRGFGDVAKRPQGSDPGSDPVADSAVDDYAAEVIDLLDSLHIHEAVIVGLSMGGYVALAIAVLAVLAAATGFVPARKASRLDPLVALRDE